MECEILNLQKRVAELEAALAEISQERRRWFSRRAGLTMLVCAVVGAVGFAFTFSATAQGPSKVTAPFQVVDNHGKVLFSVWADPQTGASSLTVWNQQGRPATEIVTTQAGNGSLEIMRNAQPRVSLGVSPVGEAGVINAFSASSKAQVYIHGDLGLTHRNAAGQDIARFGIDQNSHAATVFLADEQGNKSLELGRATGSDKPDIQILRGGNLKLGIGTSKDNDGLIMLNGGKNKTNLVLQGTGIFQADNGSGKTVITLGVNGFGGGGLHLRNSSGTDVVGIFSEQGQTGIAHFFNAAGQERVTLGTYSNGKGEVCASGSVASVCVGGQKPY